MTQVAETTRIGIIGDFDPENPTHVATDKAIAHTADCLGEPFQATWLATDGPTQLEPFHGIFCSPGSPYRSMAGALDGIRFARENSVPFIGTCGGFQHAVIEYARNVMGFSNAAHAETDPLAECLFVTALSCSLVGKTMEVRLKKESRAAGAYGADRSEEAFYCNFGLNPAYRSQLEEAGLDFTGVDVDGEARIIEHPLHPFFLATLFVPQARSVTGAPHPLVRAFCQAAASYRRSRETGGNETQPSLQGGGDSNHRSGSRLAAQ
jgi:CTP synthase (UTP-ammonia lyase)